MDILGHMKEEMHHSVSKFWPLSYANEKGTNEGQIFWRDITSKSANATGIPPLARSLRELNPGYLAPKGTNVNHQFLPSLLTDINTKREYSGSTYSERACFSSSSVQLGPRLAINKVEHACEPSTVLSISS